MNKPTEKQIDDVLDKVQDQMHKGGSRYPGMTYEDGLRAAIDWLRGDEEDHPYEN